ncbi:MAG: hypothetical protein ACI3YM_03120, partial [Prevotella sp.]
NYAFFQRYLPEYKLISGDNLKAKKTELENYSQKSEATEAVGTLNNNAAVKVYNYNGHNDLAKTLCILNTILE